MRIDVTFSGTPQVAMKPFPRMRHERIEFPCAKISTFERSFLHFIQFFHEPIKRWAALSFDVQIGNINLDVFIFALNAC